MAKKRTGLTAASKAIDPTLSALFSASAGPTKAPSKSRYTALLEKPPKDAPPQLRAALNPAVEEEGDDEELSEISEELDDEDDDDDEDDEDDEGKEDDGDSSDAEVEAEAEEIKPAVPTSLDEIAESVDEPKPRKDRKRKRNVDNEDLESKYMAELAKEEPAEPSGKRKKEDQPQQVDSDEAMDDDDDNDDDDDEIPVHESLAPTATKTTEIEKAARTVFVANVASEAASSKSAKKTLMSHLSSILGKDESPIESIRFRSLAFSTGSMPKRAAYITKSVMDSTTKSANAYVVYASPAAARKAAADLNGSEVLGRHIRVDSVAHPSPTDHRRCVFVGNLGFVDDETVVSQNENGETVERKRSKVPADVEEGLWRTFGTQGKVENVRVVRDPKTRVGKGFAYVQFYDTNDVESAILLNGKKFPPMLPRILRVTRAKDPRKTALAQERATARQTAENGAQKKTKYQPKVTPEQQSMAGRAGKLLGRAAAYHQKRGDKGPKTNNTMAGMRTPEQVILEGRRASSRDALPKDLKFGKKSKSKAGRPKNRGARRAADWRKKS